MIGFLLTLNDNKNLNGKEIIASTFLYSLVRVFIAIYSYDIVHPNVFFFVAIISGLLFACFEINALNLIVKNNSELLNHASSKTKKFNIIDEQSKNINNSKNEPTIAQQHEQQTATTTTTTTETIPKKKRLMGMEALRFIASLHIILKHFYKERGSSTWIGFISWASAELTFFYALSGFVLTYQYIDSCDKLCTSDFWVKRFARLYPSYLFSILPMCFLLPARQIDMNKLIPVMLCLQTWVDNAFTNDFNTPAWTVGAMLFLYLVFPAVCRIMSCKNYIFLYTKIKFKLI
jgi:hypothetical protein